MEGSDQDLGHTRQHGSPRSNSSSGSCGTTRNLRQLDERADALDKPQKDGDSPVGTLLQVLDGLRKFLAVDNHEAVTVGDLNREARSKKVVKPKFTTDFLGAGIHEGTDELTLRAREEGVLRTFLDTSNV